MGKIVIFGAGYLGHRLAEAYNAILSPINILETKVLGDYLGKEKPDVVINAAGKTGRPNIDWFTTHKIEGIQGNVLAPINLAMECVKRNIYMAHLGSGCIYQGYKDGKGYTEEDEPNAYNDQFYAKTKIISEKVLKEFPILQVRLRMPIDYVASDRNLIDKIKKYKKVVNTQNSMTVVPDMIPALKKLIEKRRTGVYNLVNQNTISPAEIMQYYKEIVDKNQEFEVFDEAGLDAITVEKRTNCRLNISKLQAEGIEMPDVHESVKKCLKKYKENLVKQRH